MPSSCGQTPRHRSTSICTTQSPSSQRCSSAGTKKTTALSHLFLSGNWDQEFPALSCCIPRRRLRNKSPGIRPPQEELPRDRLWSCFPGEPRGSAFRVRGSIATHAAFLGFVSLWRDLDTRGTPSRPVASSDTSGLASCCCMAWRQRKSASFPSVINSGAKRAWKLLGTHSPKRTQSEIDSRALGDLNGENRRPPRGVSLKRLPAFPGILEGDRRPRPTHSGALRSAYPSLHWELPAGDHQFHLR